MKQLSDKEMVLLGLIGYALTDDEKMFNAVADMIDMKGYTKQIEAFSERCDKVGVDSKEFISYYQNILVEIVKDIVEEE